MPRRPNISESKCGERHPAKPWPPVPSQDHACQVVVVEVAVGEAHRLATVSTYDRERGGVVIWWQQAYLAADELGVCSRPAALAQKRELRLHLRHGVRRIDAHVIGVPRVVARRASQVASREHPVRTLAADSVPA